MKRIYISLAIIASLTIPQSSFAAVKAGSACKKVGSTVTEAGMKFTCVKSGKKLVWSKGVKVTVAQPKVPTPPAPEVPVVVPVVDTKAGDQCQTLGELKDNAAGKVECREIVGDKKVWIQLSKNPSGVVNTVASESVSICKLPDLRTQKTPGQGAAFPLAQAAFSSLGEVRVAVIPIDFSDAPGEANLSEIIESEKSKVDAWLAFNSQGKQRYKWSIVNEWVRAPKTSENYNWVNPGNPQGVQVLSDAEIANQLFSAASSKVDLSQLDYVFLLFPKDQKGILQEIAGRQKPVSTPKGTFNLSYFGAGKYSWIPNRTAGQFGYMRRCTHKVLQCTHLEMDHHFISAETKQVQLLRSVAGTNLYLAGLMIHKCSVFKRAMSLARRLLLHQQIKPMLDLD